MRRESLEFLAYRAGCQIYTSGGRIRRVKLSFHNSEQLSYWSKQGGGHLRSESPPSIVGASRSIFFEPICRTISRFYFISLFFPFSIQNARVFFVSHFRVPWCSLSIDSLSLSFFLCSVRGANRRRELRTQGIQTYRRGHRWKLRRTWMPSFSARLRLSFNLVRNETKRNETSRNEKSVCLPSANRAPVFSAISGTPRRASRARRIAASFSRTLTATRKGSRYARYSRASSHESPPGCQLSCSSTLTVSRVPPVCVPRVRA